MKRILGILLLSASPAAALTLSLPEGTEQTVEKTSPLAEYVILTGPADTNGAPKQILAGKRTDSVWLVPGESADTLGLITTLRDQVLDDGYQIVYECTTDACGGFDFRFSMDLIAEPEMHVDLGDFRYIAARKGPEWVALTVSRSAQSGFLQVTTLMQSRPDTPDVVPADTTSLPAQINTQGHAVLEDLRFASGSAILEDADYISLQQLRGYLLANPTARIALVGHTDTTGKTDANTALSLARAQAVMEKLIAMEVPRTQMIATGAGWVAPRTTNTTPEGRALNRRVEAVLMVGAP